MNHLNRPIYVTFLKLFGVIFLQLLINSEAFGQAALSGTTPSGLSPGKPSGSYQLDGLDNINFYNGNLSFNLPLLTLGGRGEARFDLTLNIDTTWTVVGAGPNTLPSIDPNGFYPVGKPPTFNPGFMVARNGVDEFADCGDGRLAPWYEYTLVRLSFTSSDGTQLEFVDAQTGGLPYNWNANCYTGYQNRSRGRIFYSSDRTATFISDTDIVESNYDTADVRVTGWMKRNNGVSYRIENGLTTEIIDRNGNYITFAYDEIPLPEGGPDRMQLISITDSLNRQVTIDYNVSEPSPVGLCDKITYKGTNGTDRVIRISKRPFGEVLRPDQPLLTFAQMWGIGGWNWSYNTVVPATVWLPNQEKYNFKYNSYIELARVELPTGGIYEYDHGPGTSDQDISGQSGLAILSDYNWVVYRRLTAKRIFDENGVLERSINVSRYEHEPFTSATDVTVSTTSSAGNLLSKYRHYFLGNPHSSFQLNGVQYDASFPLEYKTELYSADGSRVVTTTENTWQFFGTISAPPTSAYPGFPGTPQIVESKASLLDTAPNLTSRQMFTYDQYMNVADIYRYDFGSSGVGAFLSRQHFQYVTDSNYVSDTGAHLRSLPAQTWVSSDIGGNNKVSLTQFEYDNYSNDSNHAPLTSRSNVSKHDTTNFGTGRLTRGNVTTVTSYQNAQNQSGAVSKYSQYDILGNVVKAIDANGNATAISYADNFGSPDGEATTNTAPSQLNGLNTYALATSATNPLGWTTYVQYDYSTGQPVNSRDVNGVVSKTVYNDPLDRPTQSVTAVGTMNEAQTTILYDDVNHKIQTTSDLFTLNDNFVRSESFYDGLGRTVETRSYKDGDYISVRTEYDGLGRVKRATKPYRPSRNESELWTRTAYDELGRIVEIETPDGASVSTTYEGNTATVTDQAGKQRRSVTNALGQLIRVDEPDAAGQLGDASSPTQATYYTYNTLGKMVQVNQGVQNRYFLYDSLGRLLRVRQPEQEVNTYLNTSGNPGNNSWTAGFTYDANGNVLTTTDANNVTIATAYDGLNRQYSRTYSDSTPDVSYIYDDPLVANSKGKLTKVSSSVSETRYTEYDENGKIKATEQKTDGRIYASTYTYNLGGILIEQTYPSGRVVRNIVDADGELSNIASRVANGMFKNYASNFEYTPSGVIKHLQLGNGLWESAELNTRNQVTELKMGHSATDGSLMHLNYDYGEFDASGNVDATKNSGNIAKQTITVTGLANPFVQTYKYDRLDRITEAKETVNETQNWIQQFGYDRYGNRTALSETVQGQAKPINEVTLPSVDANTNRFASGTDYEYDAVGNLIRDAHGRQFTFNGDNKQVEVKDQFDTVVGTYLYDGNGKRVKKVVQSTGETTVFVYDGFGKLIAEYSTEQASSPTVNYTATDPLGSPRVITNKQGEVVSRRDFMPFGEEITPDASYRSAALKYGISDGVRQKFTGYQRDEETDLDFAEARYYYNDHGRFTAVDPLLASGKSANPQTFNRYAYTMNRPLILTDAKGLQAGKPPVQSETPRRTFQIVGRTFVPGTMVVRIPITSGVGGGIVVTGYKSETVPSGRELNVVKTNDAVNNILSDYAGKVYQNEHTVRSAIRNTEENKGLADLSSATLSTSVGGSGDTNKTGSVNITTGLSVTLDITNTADIRIQGDNANDALRSSARIALENTPTVTTASPDVPVALTTDEINGLLAGANAVAVSQVEKDLDKNKEVERLAKEAEKTLPRE